MTDRDVDGRVVQIAREWVGTAYVHQASTQGAGTDCLGLIRGVWRRLYGTEPELVPAYCRDWGEVGRDEVLMAGAARHLHPVSGSCDQIGQVLVFRMRSEAIAKHLGIVSRVGESVSFIHAYEKYGVVESPLSAPWRARIAGRFQFPDQQ